MNRRQHLAKLGCGMAAGLSITSWPYRQLGRAIGGFGINHLLVRSSWQTINIGDIAHTPGLLRLLRDAYPTLKISLWANDLGNGVENMLKHRFPEVHIFTTREEPSVRAAIEPCDFLLHGSGPFLVGRREIDRWRRETNKPYGVFGITFGEHEELPQMIDLLNGARFVFFRDSRSLAFAHSQGVSGPQMAFGPDAAFATDVRNDVAAQKYLAANGLEENEFVCVIPRYRFTPNWLIPSKKRAFNPEKDAVNQAKKEHDHKPLREAIVQIARHTDLKVLICPEDVTQVKIGGEMLYDPLPEAVKRKVVWRNEYWLTDEALSTYRRSRGLFGLEMHSPIMCIGNGIPALVGRFREQTSKGYMWEDIGLSEWLFDMDDEKDYQRYVPTVMEMVTNTDESQNKARSARQFVFNKFRERLQFLEE